MDLIAGFGPAQWLILSLAAVTAGLTKAGFSGGTLIAIPIMAGLFGSKLSSSLMLGILITADLVALWHYRKDGSLSHLARTLPWALAGIALGAFVGKAIPETVFRSLMAAFILASSALMAVREVRGQGFGIPEVWYVAAPLGLIAGFASMVGNAAGPVMALYLLSTGLGKGKIVGTTTWFFFLVNLAKLPFHIAVWHTYTASALLADLAVLPLTILATVLGVRLVRLIPEKPYRIFLISVSSIGGLSLLLV